MSKEGKREPGPVATDGGLLSPKQVRAEYGFSEHALASWRWMGTGPAFIKLSPGKSGRIRYKRAAIEKWLEERTVSGGAAA